jgi:hypothetical protein
MATTPRPSTTSGRITSLRGHSPPPADPGHHDQQQHRHRDGGQPVVRACVGRHADAIGTTGHVQRRCAERGSISAVTVGLAAWWNGVELWLTTLAFPFQLMLAMAVLLPLCAGGAWAFDGVVGWAALRRPTGRRSGEQRHR